jgi:hypothetical protein
MGSSNRNRITVVMTVQRGATRPQTSLMMKEFIIVVFVRGETHISRMSALCQQMPQPGVEAKGEGSSAEEMNIVVHSFTSIWVHSMH